VLIMGAILRKNHGGAADPSLPEPYETIECGVRACSISYTLKYGQVEFQRPDSVIDLMRRKAVERHSNNHPHPLGLHECYVWSEGEREWLDEEQARQAGV
jgi:hypothetical protein